MKVLGVIWLLVVITVVSMVVFSSRVVGGQAMPLDLNKAVNSGGLTFWTETPVLRAVNSSDMQPFGQTPEDEDSATQILQPTYLGVQVTKHWVYLQSTDNPQRGM